MPYFLRPFVSLTLAENADSIGRICCTNCAHSNGVASIFETKRHDITWILGNCEIDHFVWFSFEQVVLGIHQSAGNWIRCDHRWTWMGLKSIKWLIHRSKKWSWYLHSNTKGLHAFYQTAHDITASDLFGFELPNSKEQSHSHAFIFCEMSYFKSQFIVILAGWITHRKLKQRNTVGHTV